MSRSYKKYIKRGICCGSNTEFYRSKNRNIRRYNNNLLRTLIANFEPDEIDDRFISKKVIHDDWNEPTDGTVLVSRRNKNEYISKLKNNYYYKDGNTAEDFWNKKYGRYFKSKRFKH